MPITQSSLRRRVPLIAALAALALCLCAPQALARYVYTGNYEDDTLSVIDTATNQVVGSPIPTGEGPDSIAISPNGQTLYATSGVGDITVVNTQTNQVITTITGLPGLETIAISPDGKTAYVSSPGEDEVFVIDLQTNQVTGAPIPVGGGPLGVAFSPDGKVAYVVNYEDDNVLVIDTATRQVVGSPITVGDEPNNIVVSPDGKTLYVANEEDGTVSVIDTATRQVVGSPIPVGEDPWGLALPPNGARLYVANTNDDTVSVIDTANRQVVGGPISVGDEPYELAVTPDGKSVYVANYAGASADGSLSVIDTGNNQVSTTIPVAGGPWQVAIVPDQSPTASFATSATKKDPLNLLLSGAASTDPDGSVARYDWNFGDGVALADGGPTPTHKYAQAGIYSVGLTVTDNEGCSTNMVFTGRTAHCSGNSAAARVQAITVKAPNDFKFGKLKRNTKKGTAKLTIKVPSAGKIVVAGKKVKRAQRSAKKAGSLTVNIRPKPKAKKQLAAAGSAKVRVKVTFRPTGGDQLTKSRSVKLIQR